MGKAGGTRKDTVVIGDQLVTDVLGAHFVGLPAYMLQPLVEADLWHTLLLRHFERLVMGARLPEPAPSSAQAEGTACAASNGEGVARPLAPAAVPPNLRKEAAR